jgi:5-formyltetrahydrofolate cyclo-ligase
LELDASTLLAPETRDVCFLVPGLGFDQRGVRLGRGSGWYDRALARHPQGVRVGLAYEFQLVPSLPEATWDVRMNAVVTEARVLDGIAQCIGQ